MDQAETWRELLGRCIENPQERQRLADALGINPMTLNRWVTGESDPRQQNLRRLLQALPQYRERFIALIEQEFKGFSTMMQGEAGQLESAVIPSEFYFRALHTWAITPKSLLFLLLCDLILQQALEQLDPHRHGMAVTAACCMPPCTSRKKVLSLHEKVGRGTPPWTRELEYQAIFLGAESLAGHVITSGHLEVNQNLQDKNSLSAGYRGPWEVSAAAVPIMSMGKVAGSLLISSTRPDYFLPTRCKLIEQYAELIALAFAPEDFYELEQIELAPLPSYEVQQPYLAGFRKRVNELMLQDASRQHLMTIFEAEQIVWQQIEAELLKRSLVEGR